MRNIILLAVMTICASSSTFHQLMDAISKESVKQQFKLWHYALQKPYDINSQVALLKYKVFKENLKYIEKTNMSQSNYKLGLGPFTDLTWEEFKEGYLSEFYDPSDKKKNKNEHNLINFDKLADLEDDDNPPNPLEEISANSKVIESKDWSNLHAEAKNQRGCSSCWAFATVASLEGQLLINGINAKLSEQELVDCTRNENSPGCKGGYLDTAFNYVEGHGLALGSDYRYYANSEEYFQPCKAERYPRAISGFESLLSCSVWAEEKCTPNLIKSHLENGPIASNIEVDNGLQHYRQGSWYPSKCKKINHSVEVLYIKYNTSTKKGKAVIRNSWGSNWGNNGKGEVIFDPNQGLSGCGLLLHSFIAVGVKFETQ